MSIPISFITWIASGRTAVASVPALNAVGVALATLTDEQREAISLRFFAGLSAREAAEAMGKQEGTVRGLQFRAIAALRRELGIEDEAIAMAGFRTPRRASVTNDG